MAAIYEEVEIEDMAFDECELVFSYPCPCGDKFSIGLEELEDGEDIASCPSCTLRIRVIFDEEYVMSKRTAASKTDPVPDNHNIDSDISTIETTS